MGKLKYIKAYRQAHKLQKELIQEILIFQETIKHHGYNADYILVCRYILCATIDDILSNTAWGGQGRWDAFSLLNALNQESDKPHDHVHSHGARFFSILERALQEPAHYIDLMELMYISLSLGYKGHYRGTEHSHYQLEQIINNLYRHIRAYRGSFSRTLSPYPVKPNKHISGNKTSSSTSLVFIFFVTACIIMSIFISLGYVMDVISNEAYKNISGIQTSFSQ